MKTKVTSSPELPHNAVISCTGCEASCCRLEVMIISDTGVPEHFIKIDQWGGSTMNRLEDGWCAALDRESMMCTIYENRPQICRDLKMGEYECLTERTINNIQPLPLSK